MRERVLLVLLMALPFGAAGNAQPAAKKMTAPELIALAKAKDAGLEQAIRGTFEEKELKEGTAWAGYGPDFFFAIEADTMPSLVIDDTATGMAMEAVPRGKAEGRLRYAAMRIDPVGKLHAFHYLVDGKAFGGKLDLPAYGKLSYAIPGVPQGKLSDKIEHVSKVYEGMKSNYWIYVPAQYNAKTPVALMVFQDGEGYAKRPEDAGADNGILNVIDNLIAEKKIPVMICVFINPGDITDAPGTETYKGIKAHADRVKRTLKDATRSTLYDTVSDKYDKYLVGEILAEVGAKYNLRKDAYSRAITGLSSGGICSFNAAWQEPDQFSRVISWIGSFTAIQWRERPDVVDGGQDYPEKIRREEHRNIRVWLQDGANDLEVPNWGSWPLANLKMANALKAMGYDFHLSFGNGTHNPGHGAAEFPEEMAWLWRGYDAAKTEEIYVMDPAEKALPYFRVGVVNRSAE
jgi:enterochelin esterase-like enzyme